MQIKNRQHAHQQEGEMNNPHANQNAPVAIILHRCPEGRVYQSSRGWKSITVLRQKGGDLFPRQRCTNKSADDERIIIVWCVETPRVPLDSLPDD